MNSLHMPDNTFQRVAHFLFSFFRRISTEMGDRKARELDVMFLETSAKSGHNVKQVK